MPVIEAKEKMEAEVIGGIVEGLYQYALLLVAAVAGFHAFPDLKLFIGATLLLGLAAIRGQLNAINAGRTLVNRELWHEHLTLRFGLIELHRRTIDARKDDYADELEGVWREASSAAREDITDYDEGEAMMSKLKSPVFGKWTRGIFSGLMVVAGDLITVGIADFLS